MKFKFNVAPVCPECGNTMTNIFHEGAVVNACDFPGCKMNGRLFKLPEIEFEEITQPQNP